MTFSFKTKLFPACEQKNTLGMTTISIQFTCENAIYFL